MTVTATPVRSERNTASLHILQVNALPCAQALPGFLDARKETCVILKPVVEPVVLRREPAQDAGRLPVPRDDISSDSARRRYFDRSSLISDRATCFIGFTVVGER